MVCETFDVRARLPSTKRSTRLLTVKSLASYLKRSRWGRGHNVQVHIPLKPSVTVSAEMERRFPLYALRDILCKLEAVVTLGVDGRHSIDRRSAIRTENTTTTGLAMRTVSHEHPHIQSLHGHSRAEQRSWAKRCGIRCGDGLRRRRSRHGHRHIQVHRHGG